MALQVLDTLEYLHNLEPPVIYRDLKPSNVMITPSEQVKLIDFGIARLFQPLSNATMIGTQGYAPPEQYRGKVEFRSDLYALGATMHHALSGRDPALEPPFSFPPLHSLCPDVTPALCELVDQALKYDVALRVADTAEFRQRLIAIKSGAPIAMPQRNSATGAVVASATQAAAGGLKSSEQQASAPTMLSDQIDTRMSAMRPEHPGGFELLLVLRGRRNGTIVGRWIAARRHEAQTIMLDDVASPGEFPGPIFQQHRRRRRPARTLALVVGGFFLSGYLIFHSSLPQPSDGDTGPDPTTVRFLRCRTLMRPRPRAGRAGAYRAARDSAAPRARRTGLQLGPFQNGRRHDHVMGLSADRSRSTDGADADFPGGANFLDRRPPPGAR